MRSNPKTQLARCRPDVSDAGLAESVLQTRGEEFAAARNAASTSSFRPSLRQATMGDDTVVKPLEHVPDGLFVGR